jgi:hypothetical protein
MNLLPSLPKPNEIFTSKILKPSKFHQKPQLTAKTMKQNRKIATKKHIERRKFRKNRLPPQIFRTERGCESASAPR